MSTWRGVRNQYISLIRHRISPDIGLSHWKAQFPCLGDLGLPYMLTRRPLSSIAVVALSSRYIISPQSTFLHIARALPSMSGRLASSNKS
ncbi:hypothetical protein K449DRAFT_449412 [Hypoxylon sp. EC38]|nr:hypothetical protein K449DRAFT_449412 [Hypoxylon sp. EC38]